MIRSGDLGVLQDRLTYNFKNLTLLEQALVHKSYLNERKDLKLGSNERLAWLGDAVFYLVAADQLYSSELGDKGKLTELRKRIIRNQRAAESGRMLELDRFLLLSRGESARKEKSRKILADAFEALIGAVFLDGGYQTSKDVLWRALTKI